MTRLLGFLIVIVLGGADAQHVHAWLAQRVPPSPSPAPTNWYLQSGARGDGKSIDSPTGSVATVERLSVEGDRIMLLPSDAALDGGIALKRGQRLIGLTVGGRKPVITNSDSTRNLGCGVLLASESSVSNVRIDGSVASGIYGRHVSGVRIDSVDVHGSNRAEAFIDATFPTLPGRVPHGGMVFVHADSTAEVEVTASTVTGTAGLGIASIASGEARTRLVVRHSRVEGGSRMGFYDVGIAVLVRDAAATTRLEISDSQVKGRMSRSGRNVMIAASGGARADARIERILSGATGQEGIVGAVMQSPSQIKIYIGHSVVEQAGQMNVEGSLINLPPEASAPADSAQVSIEIEQSIIRNAGGAPEFEDIASNVWMGGSQFITDAPPAVGRYTLRITDSRIERAGRSGLEFGSKRIAASGLSETSTFDVLLRGSTIANNGEVDVKLFARGARIDARRNCWGHPAGLAEHRLLRSATTERSQLDASEPLTCEER